MESAPRIHLDSPDLEPIVGALGVAACILKPFEFDLISRTLGDSTTLGNVGTIRFRRRLYDTYAFLRKYFGSTLGRLHPRSLRIPAGH